MSTIKISERNYIEHLENGILQPWLAHSLDHNHGGFLGQLGKNWQPTPQAPKGLVQHTRFLWSFSAAFRKTGKKNYQEAAEHARSFLEKYFRDRLQDGWFWSVDFRGNPLDRRKHVYPHSFLIYSFSECARAFHDQEALRTALNTFELVDHRAHDDQYLGYHECFSDDWQPTEQHEDMGIEGQRKSMNTHIHMLEALTTLTLACRELKIEPPAGLLIRVNELIDLCCRKIFNPLRESLDLFFEKDWTRLASPTSYGHDIELSWLLDESAEVVQRRSETQRVTDLLATNTLKGVADGLLYEGDAQGKPIDFKRVWWVQAEALVGFLNAYRLTQNAKYLDAFQKIEQWVFSAQADLIDGDWHEEITSENEVIGEKGHLWKEPYHQSRCCLEVTRRLSTGK